MKKSVDLTPTPQLRLLLDYLANRVAPTLLELRKILPEKLFVVERGFMDGVTIFSEIETLTETREDAIEWIYKVAPKSDIVCHEIRDFLVRQSARTRKEERFWTRVFRQASDHRFGPPRRNDVMCGTYYSIAEIELRDLALCLNNR